MHDQISLVAMNNYTPLDSSHATLGMLESLIKLSPKVVSKFNETSFNLSEYPSKKAQENYDATQKW
jgi:hypothetical protein